MRQVLKGRYLVEQVVQKRCQGGDKGRVEYQTKWEGYPQAQNTWEPVEHLENCSHLVNEYEDFLKKVRSKGVNFKYQSSGYVYYKKQPLFSRQDQERVRTPREHSIPPLRQDTPPPPKQLLPQNLLNAFMDVHKHQNALLAENKEKLERGLRKMAGNQESMAECQQAFCERLMRLQEHQHESMLQMVEKKVKGGEQWVGEQVLQSEKREDGMYYKVKWRAQPDGPAPESWMSSQALKSVQPALLVEYYESGVQSPSRSEVDHLRQMLGQG